MYGSSYVGATQWLAAVTAPPHLFTIVPANTASDYYDGWTYEGGEFRLAFVLPWTISAIAKGAAAEPPRRRHVAELSAAGTDVTRWLNFEPIRICHRCDLTARRWRRITSTGLRTRRATISGDSAASGTATPAVTVPVLDVEGWYDSFLAGGIENFVGMAAHGGSAAGPHQSAPRDRSVGPRQLGPRTRRNPHRC